MMKRLFDIRYGLMILFLLASCQQEQLVDNSNGLPNDGTLRFAGINAQQVNVGTRADILGYFPENSHYRIWAYADETGGENRTLRFNAAGIETATHVIQFPDIEGNKAELYFKDEKDVIDFYGLIDPTQQTPATSDNYNDYVLNYMQAKEDAGGNPTITVSRGTEAGVNDTLPDWRYAVKTGCTQATTEYIIQLQFKHILSKVRFEILQEVDDEGTTGKYGALTLEGIKVLNRPTTGTFDIKEGNFTAYDKDESYPVELPMQEDNTRSIPIGTTPTEAGKVLLFPMITDPTENNMLNVEVTLGSKTKDLLEPFTDDNTAITGTDGSYRLAINCPIYANPTSTDQTQQPLKLEPNYEYVLQFMIMSNDVRIITIVPRVYEWVDGETSGHNDEDGYYEEQDMGQPVTFNGVVWSDRNLGASSAHPLRSLDDWRKSVGYFYQYNRNIPFYPNTYKNGRIDLHTKLETAFHEERADANGPYKEDNYTEDFNGKKRKLYPVVNFTAWGIKDKDYPTEEYLKPQQISTSSNHVILVDKDKLPSDNPYWGINLSLQREDWITRSIWKGELGNFYREPEQPCPPGWRIPTRLNFMGILPSSGYAGNITIRFFTKATGGAGYTGLNDTEPDFYHYYKKGGEGMTRQVNQRDDKTPDTNMPLMIDDQGNKVAYFGEWPCLYREEKDDPEKGAESCYVLSMVDDDWTRVIDSSRKLKDKEGFVYNWGVIYGIKNKGTANAYRVKWELRLVEETFEGITSDLSAAKQYSTPANTTQYEGKTARIYKGLYGVLVISRYPATSEDDFEPVDGSYEWVARKKEWWANPTEVIYLPVTGVAGRWNGGHLYNIGSESWYAMITHGLDSKKVAWLKFSGGNAANQGVFYTPETVDFQDLVSIRCVRGNPEAWYGQED